MTEYQGRVLKLVSGLMMLVLGATLVIDPTFLNNLVGAGATLVAAVAGGLAIVAIPLAVLRSRTTAAIGDSIRLGAQ